MNFLVSRCELVSFDVGQYKSKCVGRWCASIRRGNQLDVQPPSVVGGRLVYGH